MTFKQYRRLKNLIGHVSSFGEFIEECAKWPRRYAVVSPKNWTKLDYQWFYDRIKGGHNYQTLFQAVDHAA